MQLEEIIHGLSKKGIGLHKFVNEKQVLENIKLFFAN